MFKRRADGELKISTGPLKTLFPSIVSIDFSAWSLPNGITSTMSAHNLRNLRPCSGPKGCEDPSLILPVSMFQAASCVCFWASPVRAGILRYTCVSEFTRYVPEYSHKAFIDFHSLPQVKFILWSFQILFMLKRINIQRFKLELGGINWRKVEFWPFVLCPITKLSLVPKLWSMVLHFSIYWGKCIPFHVLFFCVDVGIVTKLLFWCFFNLKLTYSGDEAKYAHI